MTRLKRITELEIKLQNPDLTLHSRLRDTETLKDLKYIDELEHRYKSLQGAYVRLKERGLKAGRKHCWRDGTTVIEYCDFCDNCIQPGDPGWSEGDE